MEGPFVDGVASGWTSNSYGVNAVSYSAEDRDTHSGRYAQRVTCTQFENGGVQLYQGGIALAAGTQYTIDLWLRGDVESDVFVGLREHSAPYTRYVQQFVHVTPTWRRFVIQGTTSRSDPSAGLYIMFQGTGTLVLDDVRVLRGMPVLETPRRTGNLVFNGDFEVGLAGWSGPDVHRGEAGRSGAFVEGSAIESRPFEVRVAVPLVASVRIRSTRATARMTVALIESSDSGHDTPDARDRSDRSFVATRDWQRFELHHDAFPRWSSRYVVRISSDAPFELESVSVEEGETPSSGGREHRDEIGLAVSSSLVRRGDAVTVETRTTRTGRVVYMLEDLWGRTVWRAERTVGSRDSLVITPPAPGAYRIRAALVGGDAADETVIGVLPETPVASPTFGMHIADGVDKLARAVGAGVLRLHDFGTDYCEWSRAEPSAGTYRFFDREVDDLRAQGFELVGVLGGHPRWMSTRANDSWARYVSAVAEHYRGRIHIWEIWNEPYNRDFFDGTSDEYAQLLDTARRAIKRSDPDAIVVAGATSRISMEWTDALARRGVLSGADALAFHAYWSLRDVVPRQLDEPPPLVRPVERLHASGKPVFVTEAGVRSSTFASWLPEREGVHDTPLEAAAALARGYIELLSAGATQIDAYYVGAGRRSWTTAANGAYILVDPDGRPKSTLIAYAALAHVLAGATPVRVIRQRQRVLHVFQTSTGSVAAVWGAAAVLNLAGGVSCVNMMGAETAPEVDPRAPIYCSAPKLTPDELIAALRAHAGTD